MSQRPALALAALTSLCLAGASIAAPPTRTPPDASAAAAGSSAPPVVSADRSAAPPRAQPSNKHAEMVAEWHTPPAAKPRLTAEGHPVLVLEIVNTRERVEIALAGDDAEPSAEDLRRAAHALRDSRTDEEAPIDPRLLRLAYRLELHFGANAIRVISGYRAERRHRSNHARGRALDLVVPGQKDADVAAYARSLGFVGVGLYTGSGFVHLDSRHTSYFWVDASQPGRPSRTQQVLSQLAGESDAAAIARGDERPREEEPTRAPSETNADRETLTNMAKPR